MQGLMSLWQKEYHNMVLLIYSIFNKYNEFWGFGVLGFWGFGV